MRSISVTMIGASLEQRGGIAAVENLLIQHMPAEYKFDHINSHDEGSPLHRIVIFSKACFYLFWNLLKGKTDVVYIHISEGGSAIRKSILIFVTLLFRKPLLMHAHGAEFHLFFSRQPVSIQKLLGTILNGCTAFIVLSTQWEDFYTGTVGLQKEKVFVLPNPVKLPPQIPARLNRNNISILFCGRIGHRKGAYDLIRAFSLLPRELRKKSQLTFAGDGDMARALEVAEEFEVLKYIKFIGWIDSSLRDQLMTDADIFVLPSYNEGLPMALLEAMSWGLPVISTHVGGIPEVVFPGKNGLLFDPGDTVQLTDALLLLIEDESLRLSMGKAARETVLPYRIENYCLRLAGIIDLLERPETTKGAG